MVPSHCYPWNDLGIIYDKNRLPKSARRQHLYAMNSVIWADYQAIKKTHPVYSAAFFERDGGEMSTELRPIGLLKGQCRPGLVQGSQTYVHARIHMQGDRQNGTNTYFNHVRFASPPVHRTHPNIFVGHIFDVAGRVRTGADYTHGVDIPFHKRLTEIFSDDYLRELRRRPGFPPRAQYLWELSSPQNLDFIESQTHIATMYKHRERDPSYPNHLWELHRWIVDKSNSRKPTPKFIWSAAVFKSQTNNDPCVGFQQHPTREDKGTYLRPTELITWTLTEMKDFDDVDGNLTIFPCAEADDKVWLEMPRQLCPTIGSKVVTS